MTGTLTVNLTKAEVEAILIAHVAEKVRIEDLVLVKGEHSLGECRFNYGPTRKETEPVIHSITVTIEVADNE